ncbi:hypothetical protein EKO27_g1485 [Xylaria grammica]|uniref:SUN domain-containing protein n=1 Tax=Xylaria grammica TaxID=363999 RepID=A0A439DGR8_9PEZI|nr:hypothetical protein EKO27_g1485 [Xylaria grammica]
MPPKTKKGSGSGPQERGSDPNPDLPGLFPSHDGSYGINTLVSNNGNSKKGRKTTAGVQNEQLDDKKWARAMLNRHGMNDNLKKAIAESHEEVEKEEGYQEEHQGQNPPDSSKPPDDSGFIPQLTPHIPNYTPSSLPFPEDNDRPPRPPYKPAELASADPYAEFGINQPISPPSEYIPFYGMPQGEGSKEPISPTRPNTSRSFNYENRLFANATLQPPLGQTTSLFGRSPTAAPGPWSGQNQRPAPFGTTGITNAGVQPPAQPGQRPPTPPSNSSTSSPASSKHPSSQGLPSPGQSMGGQLSPPGKPTPSSQPTSGAQPKPQEPTPGQPSMGQPPMGQPPMVQPPMGQPPTGQPPMVQPSMIQPPMVQPSMGQPSIGQPISGGRPSQSRQLPTPNTSNERNAAPIPAPTKVSGSATTSTRKPTPARLSKNNSSKNPRVVRDQKQSSPSKPRRKASPRDTATRSARKGICLTSSLLIPPLVLLFSMVLSLWLTLYSTGPEGFNGGGPGAPAASRTATNLGSGGIWGAITGLMPPIPEIPRGSSGIDDIDTNELVEDLKEWMPESIWVQGDKTKKIKISEDFWHAVKERILQDDSILSLKNSDISEDHWRAIKSRIQVNGFGAGASISNIEPLVEKKVSQSWDAWLERNDQALKKALTGVALTKDEFMQLFQEEIASYQREIRQEHAALQERIRQITEQIAKLPDKADSTGSLTKDEITSILEPLVSKAVKNAKLDAVAQGLINSHISDVLANQVNFFGIGAGASIDPESSSPAWKIPKNPLNSKKWLDKDGYKAQPPMAALSPWTQEGECYCAGPNRKGYGIGTNNLTVTTSRNIIPQHLIVEHILSGATLDPDATPREIEVWIYIEELSLRKEVQAFSDAQFPNTPKELVLNDGFVKIGHFTYERRNSGDGVQVFKIRDEIATMKAFTNRIVVRAINNYGADHTCFYRLKLYGDIIERPDDPTARSETSWFSF